MRGFLSILCVIGFSFYYGKHIGWDNTLQQLGINLSDDMDTSKTIKNHRLKVELSDYDCSIDFNEITVKGTVTNTTNQHMMLQVEATIDFEDGGVITYTSKRNDLLVLQVGGSDSFNFIGSTQNNFGLESCNVEFLDVASRTYISYQ